jgi:hypothetical protein
MAGNAVACGTKMLKRRGADTAAGASEKDVHPKGGSPAVSSLRALCSQ